MLLTLFASIVCAAIPVADPLEVSAQAAEGESPVELGVHLTSTTFRARNFSDVMQLLVLSRGAGEPVFVALPVEGMVHYSFAPEALEGVKLEVVSLREGAWKTTGYHTLSALIETGESTVWSQPGETRLHAWLQVGCEVSLIPFEGSGLPEGFLESGSTSESLVAPTHVPVITPSGGSTGDVPPEIEPEPLPPV